VLCGCHVERFRPDIDLEPGPASGDTGDNDCQTRAVASDRRAICDGGLIIVAEDAESVQPVLRRERHAFDLADVGHYAGEHQNLPNPVLPNVMARPPGSKNGVTSLAMPYQTQRLKDVGARRQDGHNDFKRNSI
jgi:hypothetical protein